MKLIIATLTAATVLASTATAMTTPTQVDPRDAALGAVGFVTTGEVSQVETQTYAADGRSAALAVNETVTVTTFETSERPFSASDYR